MTDTTTPEPRQPRQQGLQHVSIPLAKAMEELIPLAERYQRWIENQMEEKSK